MANRKVVFVSKLKDGVENRVIDELKSSFPSDAIAKIDGIEEITICQGSGMFAAIVEYDGDFEKIFASYIASPAVQSFHAKIAAFLEDAPKTTLPAELPLAGDVLYWDGKKVQEAVG
ncbi:MAG TPA: hypothetical protein VNN73_03310 [Blastocatellia bacterium]|nr:hypothetical protein [Blastocatellia bacterium]